MSAGTARDMSTPAVMSQSTRHLLESHELRIADEDCEELAQIVKTGDAFMVIVEHYACRKLEEILGS